MIAVRVRSLPANSSTSIIQGGPGWIIGDYLTAHLYTAMTGHEHPAYPKRPEIVDPAKEKLRTAALVRKRERERAIEAGEIT